MKKRRTKEALHAMREETRQADTGYEGRRIRDLALQLLPQLPDKIGQKRRVLKAAMKLIDRVYS